MHTSLHALSATWPQASRGTLRSFKERHNKANCRSCFNMSEQNKRKTKPADKSEIRPRRALVFQIDHPRFGWIVVIL